MSLKNAIVNLVGFFQGKPKEAADPISVQPGSVQGLVGAPTTETRPTAMKAFISYAHQEREVAGRVADALDQIGIESFKAHEDLKVSDPWRDRIIEELDGCDLFVPLLSRAFRESNWASQEVGIAIAKGVLVFPLMLDETVPYGFLSQLQGERIDPLEPVKVLLPGLVSREPRRVLPLMIERLGRVNSFGEADSWSSQLEPYVDQLNPEEANRLLHLSVVHREIWEAHHHQRGNSSLLPGLLRVHRDHLDVTKVEMLEHQIRTGVSHPDAEPLVQTWWQERYGNHPV